MQQIAANGWCGRVQVDLHILSAHASTAAQSLASRFPPHGEVSQHVTHFISTVCRPLTPSTRSAFTARLTASSANRSNYPTGYYHTSSLSRVNVSISSFSHTSSPTPVCAIASYMFLRTDRSSLSSFSFYICSSVKTLLQHRVDALVQIHLCHVHLDSHDRFVRVAAPALVLVHRAAQLTKRHYTLHMSLEISSSRRTVSLLTDEVTNFT